MISSGYITDKNIILQDTLYAANLWASYAVFWEYFEEKLPYYNEFWLNAGLEKRRNSGAWTIYLKAYLIKHALGLGFGVQYVDMFTSEFLMERKQT